MLFFFAANTNKKQGRSKNMEPKKQDKKPKEPLERITNTFRCAHMPPIPTDVQGWYTGTGEHGDAPVQDADDL